MVYGLKDRNIKNLLVFSQKIVDLTIFFHRLPPNRGGKGKNSPFGPRLTPSAKIGHVGVYFAQTGCKIEDGFTDIFGVVVRHLGWADGVFCLAFAPWALKSFAAKRKKMAVAISPWRSHLFSSLILTLL